MTRYIAIWHEDNDAGVPKHVMGASPLFGTRTEANEWIARSVEEDRARHNESRYPADDFCDEPEGETRFTRANGQNTWYSVEEVKVPDDGELLDKADALIDTVNRLAAERGADDIVDLIAKYYKAVQAKDCLVDIRCCPTLCVRVKARGEEEAERLVLEQLGSHTLFLTDGQKRGLVEDILENADEVSAEVDE